MFGEPVQTAEGNEFPTRWSGNEDKIAVSLNLGNAKGASVNVAADYKSATFDADFTQSEVEAPFVFYALSPFSASVGASSTHGGYHLAIPSEQTPIAGSCDEAAQILAASKSVASVDEFSNIELHFSHVTAYGRLTLKNMRIPEGQAIKSIDLTASVPFAGRFYYVFADGSLEESATSRTVTLLPDKLQPSRSGGYLYENNYYFFGGFYKTDENDNPLEWAADWPYNGLVSEYNLTSTESRYSWDVLFDFTMKVGDFEAPDTGYNYISDPGNGVYHAGDMFEFNLVETSGSRKPQGAIEWYYDDERVTEPSVMLTYGSHIVEARFTTAEGGTKTVELELSVGQ